MIGTCSNAAEQPEQPEQHQQQQQQEQQEQQQKQADQQEDGDRWRDNKYKKKFISNGVQFCTSNPDPFPTGL